MRRVSLSPQKRSENNVLLFLRQPRTIARILAGLFSLIIFASLVTDGYQNLTTSSQLRCVLNDNWVACSYAITAGVLAFLQSFLFLAFDAYDNIIISHKVKSVILSLDLTFSIIWSCVWFVGFCFLANQWNRSAHHYLLGSSSASASIAFAFFSIPCWVYLGYRALRGLWAERPISYKQSLDEGTVALTTLSSVTTTSIPDSMEYHSPIEGRRASSTPTEGRRASSTPTEGRRASSTPTEGRRASSTPTEGRRASSTPTEGRRASSTPFPQTPMGNRLTFLNDN